MKNDIILSSLSHTWIVDIDGTVCKHNGYIIDGFDTILPGVKSFFEQIPEQDLVIFVTSRDAKYKRITETFLKENGIRFDFVIYNAPYGERLIINDNKPSGLVMAKAICIDRNSGLPNRIIIDSSK